jgi:hypothetical protein
MSATQPDPTLGGPAGVPGRPIPGIPAALGPDAPFDPLRLCIFATVALLTWVFGPWALLAFSLLGLRGYWRAHKAGLTRSKCYLRDVRLVLAYLGVLAVAGAVGAAFWLRSVL